MVCDVCKERDAAVHLTTIEDNAVRCPVCGAITVQEKCKVICRSEQCRGLIILNCSEF